MKNTNGLMLFLFLALTVTFLSCGQQGKTLDNPLVGSAIELQDTPNQNAELASINHQGPLQIIDGCIPRPIGPFTHEIHAYVGCAPVPGFCTDPFPPLPSNPLDIYWVRKILPYLGGNQSAGVAYLTQDLDFVMELNASAFSNDYVDHLLTKKIFTISQEYIIPEELIRELYTCANAPVPQFRTGLPAGDYLVDVDRSAPNNEGTGERTLVLRLHQSSNGTADLSVSFYCC